MSSQPTWINWNDGQQYRKVTDIFGGSNVGGAGQESVCDPQNNYFGYDNGLKWLDVGYFDVSGKSNSFAYLKYSSNPNYIWNMTNQTTQNGKMTTSTLGFTPNPSNLLTNDPQPSSSYPRGLYFNCDDKQDTLGGVNCNGPTDKDNILCLNTMSIADAVSNNNSDFFNNNFCYGNNLDGKLVLVDKRNTDYYNNLLQSQYVSGFTGPASATTYPVFAQTKAIPSPSNGSICPATVNTPNTTYYGYPNNVGLNPTQLIDEQNAVNCCSLSATTVQNQLKTTPPWANFPMCSKAFNPDTANNTGSLCVPLMTDYCENYWNNKNPSITTACNTFVGAGNNASLQYVQGAVTNYFTAPTRVPQDYISTNIANSNAKSLSAEYYNYFKGKQPMAKYDGTDLPLCKYDPNNPANSDGRFAKCALRNDSIDPFFTNIGTMINGLGSNSNGMTQILNYVCAPYDRNDLSSETEDGVMTLTNMCGCFLVGSAGATPTTPPNPANGQIWSLTTPAQTQSPYYSGGSPSTAGGIPCDPLCINSSIQNSSGPCTTQQCIVDNVNYNCIQGKCGNNNINLNCSGGSCYISDITVTQYGGSNKGGLNLSANCNSCYSFTDNNISNATPISCSTGDPLPSPEPYDPSLFTKWWNWILAHKWESAGIIVFVAIVLCLIIWLIYSMLKPSPKQSPTSFPIGSSTTPSRSPNQIAIA